MVKSWKEYVDVTVEKSNYHLKKARSWETISSCLCIMLVLFAASTTIMTFVEKIPHTVISGMAGVTTLLAAMLAFLRPADRKAKQESIAKEFRLLTLRMVRCRTAHEYETLWKELNRVLLGERFLPKRFATTTKLNWQMSPELVLLLDPSACSSQASTSSSHFSEVKVDEVGKSASSSSTDEEKKKVE